MLESRRLASDSKDSLAPDPATFDGETQPVLHDPGVFGAGWWDKR